MVPTYGSNKTRRYTYYETRKDLARPGDPSSTRFQRAHLEQHIITHLEQLLTDEHSLRRLSGIKEAGQLRTMFTSALSLASQLRELGKVEPVLRSLVSSITIKTDQMEICLKPDAVGITMEGLWKWSIPRPTQKPFREAKLRIDSKGSTSTASADLIDLFADAMQAQRLILESPELSLNQLAKREGRCRTQLARLLRLSWISPKIIEAIANDSQPKGLSRRILLTHELPIEWAVQEKQLGFTV